MTAFAASRDETKAVMMGALLVMEPDRVRMVATDTYRLALRAQPASLTLKEPVQVVIPERALGELPHRPGLLLLGHLRRQHGKADKGNEGSPRVQ